MAFNLRKHAICEIHLHGKPKPGDSHVVATTVALNSSGARVVTKEIRDRVLHHNEWIFYAARQHSRIQTSSSHHAPHQCSDSAEEWIKPGSNHPLPRRTAPMVHPSDEGVFKAAPSLKGGSQNEQPHPLFHQQPDLLQKEGVEFSGDWSAWNDCVSTTNATSLMPYLALPPW